MGVGGQRHALAALLPGKNRYPLYRELGGPQDRYGTGAENLARPGFNPQEAQPVASRYTDYVIPAHTYVLITFVIRRNCLSNGTCLLLNLRIYSINGKGLLIVETYITYL